MIPWIRVSPYFNFIISFCVLKFYPNDEISTMDEGWFFFTRHTADGKYVGVAFTVHLIII